MAPPKNPGTTSKGDPGATKPNRGIERKSGYQSPPPAREAPKPKPTQPAAPKSKK